MLNIPNVFSVKIFSISNKKIKRKGKKNWKTFQSISTQLWMHGSSCNKVINANFQTVIGKLRTVCYRKGNMVKFEFNFRKRACGFYWSILFVFGFECTIPQSLFLFTVNKYILMNGKLFWSSTQTSLEKILFYLQRKIHIWLLEYLLNSYMYVKFCTICTSIHIDASTHSAHVHNKFSIDRHFKRKTNTLQFKWNALYNVVGWCKHLHIIHNIFIETIIYVMNINCIDR